MDEFFSALPWSLIILACVTVGLAPYRPPHIWEKLQMLLAGRLVRPLDWFDFMLHSIPWALLVMKGVHALRP